MTPKVKLPDVVQEWFASLKAKALGTKPEETTYQGKIVYVYKQTEHFVIISYKDDSTGLFSISPNELK